jgi:hypothetical protein
MAIGDNGYWCKVFAISMEFAIGKVIAMSKT